MKTRPGKASASRRFAFSRKRGIMNIDELAQEIRSVSDENLVQKLADLLIEWKQDQSTVEDLKNKAERYIGNAWIEEDEDHRKIYQMWSSFRDKAISGIGAMTMNERLYFFGLSEQFDDRESEEDHLRIYKKLMAKP